MKLNLLVWLAVIALALFLGAGLAQTAFAQWSNNPTVNTPVATQLYNQELPQLCSDGTGGTIITWQDDRGGPGNGDIYAQRLNAAGVPQWATGGVAICTATNDQRSPHLICDGSGGAIITWEDLRSGPVYIYAQRVNSSGIALWSTNGVAICTTISGQWYPRLASDGLGGAIISWYDYRSLNYNIYAQHVNSSGVAQWLTNGVEICGAANTQQTPELVGDGMGGAIITWEDYRSGNFKGDIYAQRVNASGVVQWPIDGVAICATTDHQFIPQITSDGSGGAIITWTDGRGFVADIYAQRVNASGVVQWTTDGVAVCTAFNGQFWTELVSDGLGGAIITWSDTRNFNLDIYAQRVNPSGVAQWGTDGVAICTATSDQGNPQLICDGSGGAIFTWEDNRTPIHVYAQRVNVSGIVQWPTNGVAICTATGSQSNPQLVSDGLGGAIITWTDNRSGNADIYAQNVDRNGQLGVPPTIVNGGFEQGLTAWSAGGCAIPSIVPSGCNGTNVAKVSITGANCNAEFYQHGFPVERGKKYRVTFNAWSSRGEDMQLTVLPHNASTPNIGLDRRVDLGTGSCGSYSFDFTATGSTTDARLRFFFNYMSTAGYWYMFDNVSLERILPKEGELEEPVLPATYALEQNYPNPFNPTTTIKFQIPNDGQVSLKVFDVLGREVATLVNEMRAAGSYAEVFDAGRLASGIYCYRLQAGDVTQTKKLIFLR